MASFNKKIIFICILAVIIMIPIVFQVIRVRVNSSEYVIIRSVIYPSETIDIQFMNPRSIADENLIKIMNNHTAMWIGGIVRKGLIGLNNTWEFHFDPETINVSPITAEGLQSWLGYINSTIDYWNGNYAYIWATVIDY